MTIHSLFIYITSVLCLGQLPWAQAQDTFNYYMTSGTDYGPKDWGEVSCSNKNTCPGWPTNFENLTPWISYSANTCKDCSSSTTGTCAAHRQTPIALYKNVTRIRECIDIHKMGYVEGSCTFDQTQSHILPHVLRVMWPQNCTVTPQIDFSRGSPDPWNMRFMDITVPSQHTVDGKRFAAEIILSHTYSVNKSNKRRYIGNMNVLVDVGTSANYNDFMELFLVRFENMAANIRSACGLRRKLERVNSTEELQGSGPESSLRGRVQEDVAADDDDVSLPTESTERRLYSGTFHPYVWHVQSGTQYHFRYRGSWVEPPCLEDMPAEWRIMKDPVLISPDQYARLDQLFYSRLNPSTCLPESAGRPRSGSTYKKDFNRPTQTTTYMHGLTFCECIDFTSGLTNDIAYCAQSMQNRGVYPFGS